MDKNGILNGSTQIEMADIKKAAERLTLYGKGVMEIKVNHGAKGENGHDEQARV